MAYTNLHRDMYIDIHRYAHAALCVYRYTTIHIHAQEAHTETRLQTSSETPTRTWRHTMGEAYNNGLAYIAADRDNCNIRDCGAASIYIHMRT